MTIDLTGRNILVTGASRGIGGAAAIALGKAGARVAVHYRNRKDDARAVAAAAGNDSRIFCADVGDAAACNGLWADVVDTFGTIDVLVNNAGIAIEGGTDVPLEQWTRDWDTTQHVNLRAAGILSRLAIAHFRSRKSRADQGQDPSWTGGRLIHIASRAAFRGDTEDYLAYAASKGGMVSMSRSIARGCGKDGICSFAIAPGFVRTEMAQEFIESYGDAHVQNDIALTELTEPEHLSPMIVLLASGLADHATGTSIDINAGSYVH